MGGVSDGLGINCGLPTIGEAAPIGDRPLGADVEGVTEAEGVGVAGMLVGAPEQAVIDRPMASVATTTATHFSIGHLNHKTPTRPTRFPRRRRAFFEYLTALCAVKYSENPPRPPSGPSLKRRSC